MLSTIVALSFPRRISSRTFRSSPSQLLSKSSRKELNAFEVQQLMSGKFDSYGCVLSIQSGTGGVDAQDWVGMLYRMYRRFAERKNYRITVLEENSADFGYKNVEIQIEGPYAYGYLSGEKGTHRLVRISPFNSKAKRQTSFAAVETYPLLPESDIDTIDIPAKVCCS